ncbi:MAG: dipeptidase [Saprospiraceae bacterium]|nr:dipeptidase [Saprospiraceae bacterium]
MPLRNRFADLHCHPGEMMYHRLRGAQPRSVIKDDPDTFNPWNRRIIEKFLKQIKGKRAGKYLQSNPPKLISGRMKIAFASIYPIEHGFLGVNKRIHSVGNVLVRLPLLRDFFLWINKALLNMTNSRYAYLKSSTSNYYDELEAIYDFYENATGKWMDKHVSVGDENRRDILKVAGAYALCRNFSDVEDIVTEQVNVPDGVDVAGKSALVLTIEGMHAFGKGHPTTQKDATAAELKARVIDWKTNKTFPIFFITYSHHFTNQLCGHAHSLPKVTRLLADQVPLMGEGFTEEGLEIAELLLNIGRFGGANAVGKRILIDVKHMSPAGRKSLYKIVQQHNADFPNDAIPVIASHIGHCGLQSLAQVLGSGKSFLKKERDNSSAPGFEIDGKRYDFNSWGINMTDEDVVAIVASKGLLGLSMDQRVMAAKKTNGMVKGFLGFRSKKKKYRMRTNVVLNHILAIARAVDQSMLSDGDKAFVWDAITLGSDFDGFIDPIDNYPTCNHYANLQADLLEAMRAYNQAHPAGLLSRWIGSEDELINNICFDNAYEFLRKHF